MAVEFLCHASLLRNSCAYQEIRSGFLQGSDPQGIHWRTERSEAQADAEPPGGFSGGRRRGERALQAGHADGCLGCRPCSRDAERSRGGCRPRPERMMHAGRGRARRSDEIRYGECAKMEENAWRRHACAILLSVLSLERRRRSCGAGSRRRFMAMWERRGMAGTLLRSN